MVGMGWDGWKKVFYWGAGVWLSGSVVMQIARWNSDKYSTIREIDNFNTLFALVGLATFGLGVVLFCRWAWIKFRTGGDISTPLRNERRDNGTSNPPLNFTTRWEALVRYDNEIRVAAEELMPFGPEWVSRLADAFFALNEDRSYLNNIVERLRNEAKLEAESRWKSRFKRTADGEPCTQESLVILSEIRAKGYSLDVLSGGAIAVSKDGSISYLYSNSDIERFSRILSRINE
jgi:hypothetical protein